VLEGSSPFFLGAGSEVSRVDRKGQSEFHQLGPRDSDGGSATALTACRVVADWSADFVLAASSETDF
jgi:hypothetical protein